MFSRTAETGVSVEISGEGIGDLERAEDAGDVGMGEMKLGGNDGREYGEGLAADVIESGGTSMKATRG